jgi:hypothetical protein
VIYGPLQSDHPAISRTLLHEAQQAHFHGLPDHLALSSVTTVSAKTAGLDWRLGFVKKSACLVSRVQEPCLP